MKYSPICLIISAGLFANFAEAKEISPLETIYNCSAVTDDSERLQCYDVAVGRTQEAEKSGEFATITRKDAEDVQKDTFGFSIPSLPKLAFPNFGSKSDDETVIKNKTGEIEEVSLPVKSISRGRYGEVTLVFENGQVWRQSENLSVLISEKSPPASATIKRAAFGSYLIKLDTGQSFKANRRK